MRFKLDAKDNDLGAGERIHPLTWLAGAIAAGMVVALFAFFVFVANYNRETPRQVAVSSDDIPDTTRSLLDRAIAWEHAVSPQSNQQPTTVSAPGQNSDSLHESWKNCVPITRATVAGAKLSATEIYKLVAPAVVQIEVYDAGKKLTATGSGFVVTEDGSIVTNLHVVERAVEAKARLADGTLIEIIGFTAMDREADLAVLRVRGDTGLPALRLATDLPPVGAPVYAVGSPQGLTNTLSDGIVSGHRPISDGLTMIQTNAAISPGSSGGPLVAEDGRVIGVTTALLRGGQNLNLAIPASRVVLLIATGRPMTSLASMRQLMGTGEAPHSMSDDQLAIDAVQTATRKRDWATALRLLGAIPDSRRGKGYWAVLGQVHEQLGNLQESHTAYVEAVKIEPDAETLVRFAVVAYQLSSNRDLKASQPSAYGDQAREASEMAIRYSPNDARAYNLRGVLYFYLDQQKAAGAFRTAIAIEPDDLGAKFNLGMLLWSMDRNREAEDALWEALMLIQRAGDYRIVSRDPVNGLTRTQSIEALIHLALGRLFLDGKKCKEAVSCFQSALGVETDNAMACWGTCYAYRCMRKNLDDPDAIQWERRAEKLDSSAQSRFAGFGGGSALVCRK